MSVVEIEGHIDLHCHYGPDLIKDGDFSVTAVEAVREARDSGCAAIVLKAHDFPSPALALALDSTIDGIRVFGGICLDYQVGGLNPYAVEAALNLGAKIVWLPTVASHQDALNGGAAVFGYPPDGIKVVDDDGELLPVVRDIVDLVRASGAVLATGHVTREEHFAVAREYAKTSPLVVTHATEELAGPRLTKEDCVALAELGAMIEFTALTCLPFESSPGTPIEKLAAAVQAVGPDHVVLGSDLGFSEHVPHPATGYVDYIDRLYRAGASERELRVMSSDNPARLLQIDV